MSVVLPVKTNDATHFITGLFLFVCLLLLFLCAFLLLFFVCLFVWGGSGARVRLALEI